MKQLIWLIIATVKKYYIWLVYVIFACYIGYLVVHTLSPFMKLFYLTIGCLLLGIAIFYEYLKHLYQQMILALTEETNPEKAQLLKEKLIRSDKFKGFSHSLILFNSLQLLDEGCFQECLTYMEAHSKFFHSTIDYLFIYYHQQLHCFYFLKNYEQATNVIKELEKIKKINQKKYSPLFSWEEIEGIKLFLQQRFTKSIEAFKKVNLNLLNNREKTYLYTMIANDYRLLDRPNEVGKYKKLAKETGHELAVVRIN